MPRCDPILLAFAQEKALRQKVFDTTAIPVDDCVFEADEKGVLSDLPAFLLHKDEPDFGELVRALQDIAQFVKRFRAADVTAIKDHFVGELKRINKRLSISAAESCRSDLLVVADPNASRPVRLMAITSLALLNLTLSDEFRSRVPRLRLAMLSRPPTTAKEVAGWMKSGRIPTRSEVGALPVAADGLDF